MATEDRTPSLPPDAGADAWLDGLAGRAAAGPEAQDGARLRKALAPSVGESAPSAQPAWQAIVAAARAAECPPAELQGREPANQSRWKQWAGGGAAVVAIAVAAGLWMATHRDADAPGSLRGSPTPGGAIWRTADPQQSARELAARLQASGARVVVTPQEPGVLLTIECDPPTCTAVNGQLAVLDTAVDASGRAALKVLPLR